MVVGGLLQRDRSRGGAQLTVADAQIGDDLIGSPSHNFKLKHKRECDGANRRSWRRGWSSRSSHTGFKSSFAISDAKLLLLQISTSKSVSSLI
jgi:hypothetical protein